jgi:VWFA-related protein
MRSAPLLLLALLAVPARPATKLLVTVIEQKSGKPVTDLKAGDFTVLDDRTPRQVEAAEFSEGLMDVMLLLDTSLVGEMVQPLASNLIEQLQPKEQMAIVSFHSSADLIQDFTASHELLARAVAGVKYGNSPCVLDALYASIDGGFQGSAFRRVVLLLTTGMEGPSRTSERDVIRLARRNGVSIYPVYVVGAERSMLENLARQTGGASFNLRDMRKTLSGPPGKRIFGVLRSHYTLTLSGNLSLGEKLKVEVARPVKLLVSALPLE